MKLKRRQFLQAGLLGLAARTNQFNISALELSGSTFPVHDPCIIREDDTYYLFCTGPRVPVRYSNDLLSWELRGDTIRTMPDWAKEYLPNATNIWAPDISFYNNRFHLYYSVSTFGRNRSAIGLMTNFTLNRSNSSYEWIDQGMVIASTEDDDFNAIDPNLILDEGGIPWLAFGSFWSGIKLRRLDVETGKPSAEDETLYPLAARPQHAIEAPFIIHRGAFYYLFVSFDFCCRGADSTYRVMVGRAEHVTGPYLDRDSVPMLEGGGTQVTFPSERWRGPGHNAILQEESGDGIVYHAYDADAEGLPTLHIDPLAWDDAAWPFIDST